ncbi:malonyl-CoA decarboxylase domain-containing protein [Hydrogenophaga pseudoflava]|uniref:malonyl-CoA decarboxylase domain-containing protein n=1 Tax=Hydrogenophaga pseudoflava TaxID=47421 RepID=UPI0027E47405|nr:malonyl-CoA decarboxylase family protein [Hydrogenophaga pseudoflava]MDQ7744183.1 malonyl-CoA decarboxylase family protein [Hydrogenophaga pseudoflava]
MNTREWLSERVSRLRAPAGGPPPPPARSTQERLKARLRQGEEALSPRALRHKLDELKGIVDPLVSEVEGGRRAGELIDWYASASPAHRRDLWLLMSERFVADPEQVKTAQQQYAAAVGTPDEAAAEVLYRRATVSPRRRLLQRFSAHPDGIPFLVNLRAEMQPQLKTDKRLLALDVEMEYMFSTWFDVGFLELRRISWDSPASLVEKLIKYEAVHDIRSWGDVKNRLDSDRRCYGFFHPRLPGEPLIFVEVALINEIASSITPLLDESAAPADLDRATTAIFYSISNTQLGLRGVSFGDSLIKRVVESLHEEFPRLKTFATLSPIPGLRAWLNRHAPAELLQAWEVALELEEKSPPRVALKQWAARYLAQELQEGKPLDAVARFHLGNGARIERLNWAADPSAKGLKQSYGLMVNYLYDVKRLDKNRAALAQGKVPVAPAIKDLLP